MRLLDKYLFRELLIPLGYCLSGFLICLITTDVLSRVDDFQDAHLSAGQVVRYYLISLPEYLAMVLPIGLLLALLYTLTHHARHNELTAIRAAGVSLWRLSAPYFVVGAVLTVTTFIISEYWVPPAQEAASRMFVRKKGRMPASTAGIIRNLAFQNSGDNRGWLIEAYNPKTAEMTGPHVDWTMPDGTRRRFDAERAWWTNRAWLFTNVQATTYAPGATLPSDRTNLVTYVASEFSETPAQIQSEIIITSAAATTLRQAEIPLFRIYNYLRLHPRLTKSMSNWLNTQLHGRLAAPFTCLVVVFIAIPFGAPGGRRNVFVGVASSIFIVFAYYVLMSLCLALGTRGLLPPWVAAWLPNVAFTAIAIWLINRVR